MDIVAKLRVACGRAGLFAGKWALIAFAGVAAFALAVQALALVLAALALLVIALCLATLCMPDECHAVWAWMRDTLGRWSVVAGAGAAESSSADSATDASGAGDFGNAACAKADTAMAAPAESVEPAACGTKLCGSESDASSGSKKGS